MATQDKLNQLIQSSRLFLSKLFISMDTNKKTDLDEILESLDRVEEKLDILNHFLSLIVSEAEEKEINTPVVDQSLN